MGQNCVRPSSRDYRVSSKESSSNCWLPAHNNKNSNNNNNSSSSSISAALSLQQQQQQQLLLRETLAGSSRKWSVASPSLVYCIINNKADRHAAILFDCRSPWGPPNTHRGPQQGAPQQGAPQQGALQQGAPQKGGPQGGDPQQGALKKGLHRGPLKRLHRGPQGGGPQEGGPQEGGPQGGGPPLGKLHYAVCPWRCLGDVEIALKDFDAAPPLLLLKRSERPAVSRSAAANPAARSSGFVWPRMRMQTLKRLKSSVVQQQQQQQQEQQEKQEKQEQQEQQEQQQQQQQQQKEDSGSKNHEEAAQMQHMDTAASVAQRRLQAENCCGGPTEIIAPNTKLMKDVPAKDFALFISDCRVAFGNPQALKHFNIQLPFIVDTKHFPYKQAAAHVLEAYQQNKSILYYKVQRSASRGQYSVFRD
ncbi:hypothetical protein EAH_00042330 [Eimeria acervulina]|uniref:Uncharacterized protein n=1 Tax=Eimeria acervulina TaxID=5801 RepID=U6GU61_EIMAC|nr:hypothetical protein EAH_00042330 [Eimeria acervulina]CDI83710.1 hypothetical protein EAH_00042330 [Eimeria acervulina]